MKNSFSFRRWWRLMVKTVRESWREYVMMAVTVFGSLTIVFVLVGLSAATEGPNDIDPTLSIEAGTGAFMAMAFGAIAASMMFGNMSTKNLRLSTLMTPATNLEKYLVRWTIYLPAFIILFVVSFYLADFIRYAMLMTIVHAHFEPKMLSVTDMYDLTVTRNCLEFLIVVAAYIAVYSFFALGSSLWPSKSFVKTFFALAIVIAVYSFLSIMVVNIVDKPGLEGGYIVGRVIDNNNATLIAAILFFLGIAAVNYVIAYYRFKESEIIERW